MPATIHSATLQGVRAATVTVEVDLIPGLPHVTVVGLPDTAVQESRERIRSAVRNSGYEFPLRRITMSLSPADQRKEGSGFDLPIAAALLVASGQVPNLSQPSLIIGELNLNGECRPIPGMIAYAELAVRQEHLLIIPAANAPEAAVVPGVRLFPVATLTDLAAAMVRGKIRPKRITVDHTRRDRPWTVWPSIRGQASAKRAAIIAAAGGHNLLLTGPPGTGKTMIGEGIRELLPDLPDPAAIEVTNIASIAGLHRPHDPIVRQPPFRRPHHGASVAALIGGGRQPRPGEITLAHHGVLFLDEFPEFSRDHLEALRQPLEQHTVVVNRVAGTMEFPADIMLVAAMNPCPCGYAGDRQRVCHCSPLAIQRYRRRVSGPILDRFDMAVALNRVDRTELAPDTNDPRTLIATARTRARVRNDGPLNSRLPAGSETHLRCTPAALNFLRVALDQLKLSLRAYDRLLRVARTIADLAGDDALDTHHVAEAVQYRPPFSLEETSRTPTG